ncbi:MAG: LexA repressor [Pseudomonadota bacterium]
MDNQPARSPPQASQAMDDSPKLTERQQQILDLVQSTIARTGAPPTRAEIAAELGFRSPNAAEEHLQALARKGVIELVGGTARGIRLEPDTLRALNAARLSQYGKQYSLPLPGIAQLTLPLVGRVAAGSPILAQEHIDATYTVEATLFQRRPDYLLKVRGMSMRDAGILDGDLLAVKKAADAKNGQIVVARLGDEVTVKRLRRTRQGIDLIPENPEFEVIHVAPDALDFQLEGIAVGLVRNTMLT